MFSKRQCPSKPSNNVSSIYNTVNLKKYALIVEILKVKMLGISISI